MKRILIIGGGFAGINLAKKLVDINNMEVVLVDRNNYNYFPPLIYQVASSFIEPSSISYPFRKMFQRRNNIQFFKADFLSVNREQNIVNTSEGRLYYDYLVLAHGTKTDYFGMHSFYEKALPLKNINDALRIRNTILNNLEQACKETDAIERQKLLTFLIAGGGPTGVEMSGMLCEMNRNILKKDYPELAKDSLHIHLVEASPALLGSMSEKSRQETFDSLAALGVNIHLSVAVKDYKEDTIYLSNGEKIAAKTVIWVAGVIANDAAGLPQDVVSKKNRIAVNEYNLIKGTTNIFAIGDICYQLSDPSFPNAHPQVAQVAIQQGKLLAKNLKNIINNKPIKPFRYNDRGSMAIISKYKAVADLPIGFFKGIIAWCLWLFIHILPIAGFRNKVKLVFSWLWNFITNDPTLRLIIHTQKQPGEKIATKPKPAPTVLHTQE